MRTGRLSFRKLNAILFWYMVLPACKRLSKEIGTGAVNGGLAKLADNPTLVQNNYSVAVTNLSPTGDCESPVVSHQTVYPAEYFESLVVSHQTVSPTNNFESPVVPVHHIPHMWHVQRYRDHSKPEC